LAQTYSSLSERRNYAAHQADFTYQYSWLEKVQNEIITLAASIDILLEARCRQVSSDITKGVEQHDIVSALNFRFLTMSGGKYRETKKMNGRAIKIWPDLASAVSPLKTKLAVKKEFLIIMDNSKRIEDWYV